LLAESPVQVVAPASALALVFARTVVSLCINLSIHQRMGLAMCKIRLSKPYSRRGWRLVLIVIKPIIRVPNFVEGVDILCLTSIWMLIDLLRILKGDKLSTQLEQPLPRPRLLALAVALKIRQALSSVAAVVSCSRLHPTEGH
jgi:hypothetical protein